MRISLAFLLFSVMLMARAAGQGVVTDTTTGQPISGAIILVYWGHEVGPTFHGSYWWKCDGAAVATTDARGHYKLKLPFTVGLLPQSDRAPRMRVAAVGYYDDRIKPRFADDDSKFGQIMRTLAWRTHKVNEYLWSPGLLPFGQAGIDARLMALQQAYPDGEFLAAAAPEFSTCQKSAEYRQYAQSVARIFDQTLCPMDGTELRAPLAEVIRSYPSDVWPTYATEWPDTTGAWRKYVEKLLPAESVSQTPALALRNACAVTHPLVAGAASTDYFGVPTLP